MNIITSPLTIFFSTLIVYQKCGDLHTDLLIFLPVGGHDLFSLSYLELILVVYFMIYITMFLIQANSVLCKGSLILLNLLRGKFPQKMWKFG